MEKIKSKIYNTLRKSEKYTQTDMVYLSKNSFWLLLSQGIGMICVFALSVIYANFLDPNTYGVYKYIVSVAGVVAAFSLTGINTFIIQRLNTGFNINLWNLFLIGLKWHLPSFVLSSLGSIYYFINDNMVLSVSLIIVAILTPITSSSSIYDSYLSGLKKFKFKSILSSIFSLVTALTLAITVLYTNNIFLIVTAYFLINALVSFIFLIFVYKKVKINTNEKPMGSISFAKHLSLIKIIGVVGARLDSILVFTFIGAPELAIYTFATAMPNQIMGLLNNLHTLALPKFSSNQILTGKIVNKKILRLLIFSIPIYLLYCFSAPFIFKIFFPQYMDSVLLSQIFALLIIFSGAGLHGAFLDSKEEIKKKYIMNITIDVTKIILLVIFIIPFGLWGVVIARVLGKIFSYLFSVVCVSKVK